MQTQREHLQTNTCTHSVHIREVNLALVGLPPYDLLDELAKALREKGLDIDEVFQKAVSCSNEFLCPVVVGVEKYWCALHRRHTQRLLQKPRDVERKYRSHHWVRALSVWRVSRSIRAEAQQGAHDANHEA